MYNLQKLVLQWWWWSIWYLHEFLWKNGWSMMSILSQLMRILLIVFQLLMRIACVEEEYQNWIISIDKNTCYELGIDWYCKNERKYCNAQFVTATEACYCAVGSHEGYSGKVIVGLLRIGYKNYTESFAHNVTETGQLSGAICDLIKQVLNLSGFGIIQKGNDTCKDGLKGNKILCKFLRMVVHTHTCFLQIVTNCEQSCSNKFQYCWFMSWSIFE